MDEVRNKVRMHPWHGLQIGPNAPERVDAYIEMKHHSPVKYELDKDTGYLRVDRPQSGAALPPTIYGFVPRTYCGNRVAALTTDATEGDHDPLDICVLSELLIDQAGVLVTVRIIGGLSITDDGEADDKIIAVVDNDPYWCAVKTLSDVPLSVIERLQHYFATYKYSRRTGLNPIEVHGTYESEHALKVVKASMEDYEEAFIK